MGIGYRGLLRVSWAAITNKCIYVSMESYTIWLSVLCEEAADGTLVQMEYHIEHLAQVVFNLRWQSTLVLFII